MRLRRGRTINDSLLYAIIEVTMNPGIKVGGGGGGGVSKKGWWGTESKGRRRQQWRKL